jgi:malonyl-CoA O-methyltransferase
LNNLSVDLQPDRRSVRRAFEHAAQSYDASAVLQREIADRMLERLDLVRLADKRILDAGSGTGYAGPKLRAKFSPDYVLELDIAHTMLQQSMGGDSMLAQLTRRRNHRICADIEALPLASNSIGLVWSNLAIQWLDQPDTAFREFHRVLCKDGLLMFSTFGPDTLQELRQACLTVDDSPRVSRFIDMHDLGDALTRNGFAAPVMDMEKIVLTYSDIRSVMGDLKAIGAHNAAAGRKRGLFGKQAWARLEAAYEKHRSGGRLPATFEVIYGHAWKPERAERGDGTRVIEFATRPRG